MLCSARGCKNRAVYIAEHFGLRLCKKHFLRHLEKRFRHKVLRYDIFPELRKSARREPWIKGLRLLLKKFSRYAEKYPREKTEATCLEKFVAENLKAIIETGDIRKPLTAEKVLSSFSAKEYALYFILQKGTCQQEERDSRECRDSKALEELLQKYFSHGGLLNFRRLFLLMAEGDEERTDE